MIVKQALFSYVNHAQIRSWNQPVLSKFQVSCTKTGAFDGIRTHDWQASTDYESNALPTEPRHPLASQLNKNYEPWLSTLQFFHWLFPYWRSSVLHLKHWSIFLIVLPFFLTLAFNLNIISIEVSLTVVLYFNFQRLTMFNVSWNPWK